MNFTTFVSTLACYIAKYDPQQMDNSMKPIDSAGSGACKSMEFDFIIVGAGAAGCVVANRLSENPNWKVLLIEAGGDEDYVTDVPILAGMFNDTRYDWNYTTTKQENVCLDTSGYCQYHVGHVMGGSSTISGLVYARGNRADYDEWAEMGNTGWSFQDVFPYFLKSEYMTIPELVGSPYHSTKGPLPISYARYNSSAVTTLLEAAMDLGEKKMDYNGANQIAISRAQLYVLGAQRWSTSKAYLNPIRNRKNLFIFKNTLVTKVIIDSNTKTAKGVSCVTNGEQYDVYSSKEVILSSGAINSPKLLMLSGVGPRDHLEELDIPVVADLPVGQYLVDQYGIDFSFTAKFFEELELDDAQLKQAIEDYAKYGQGILTAPLRQFVAVLVSMDTSSTSTRADTVHYGGYELAALGQPQSVFNAHELMFKPQSSGTVKLKSNNYMDPPLIDPNYFQAEYDVVLCMKQIVNSMVLLEQKSWGNHEPMTVLPPQCEYNGNVTKEYTKCYIKYFSKTGFNSICTAKMGPSSDTSSVVDPVLQVHGVKQLRVVDASVIPKPMSATPLATVVMIAEKGSDLIKSTYSK